MRDVREVGEAGDFFQVGDRHHLLAGRLLALEGIGVSTHKSNTHQFIGGAILESLTGIPGLGPQQYVVEHGRNRDIAPSAKLNFLRRRAEAVTVSILLEIASNHLIEGVGTHLGVYPILQNVPAATSGIESGRKLRRNVGIIEHLLIGSE